MGWVGGEVWGGLGVHVDKVHRRCWGRGLWIGGSICKLVDLELGQRSSYRMRGS
eukprot:COSAG01_NODE_66517_length_270_cov_0.461988_1_plen_53_part_10